MPSDNLHLENSFEDTGASGQHALDMLTLESDVFQRCLSAQLALTSLRFNRCDGALLLRDLPATAALPPHSAFFAQQRTSLTLKLKLKAPTAKSTTSTPLRPRLTYAFAALRKVPLASCISACTARSLTDLTTLAVLDRRQPHNVPPLHLARTVHEVVAEEYRILLYRCALVDFGQPICDLSRMS